MDFYELAKKRYSVRSFSEKQVEPEKLEKILEAGRAAPTAKNGQPQKIYVLRSEGALEKINSVCRCIFGAKTVIAVGYDENRDWKNPLMPPYHSGETDAAIVCTHMMLEAADLGLGSCWVGFFSADEVSKALGLPENIRITALLPIGYPAADSAPSERHALRAELGETVEYL